MAFVGIVLFFVVVAVIWWGLVYLHDAGDRIVEPFTLYGPQPQAPKPVELNGAPLAHRFLPQPTKLKEAAAPVQEPENTQLKNLYDALD